jgi:hypothetical protein
MRNQVPASRGTTVRSRHLDSFCLFLLMLEEEQFVNSGGSGRGTGTGAGVHGQCIALRSHPPLDNDNGAVGMGEETWGTFGLDVS